jgi:hypothetical protein
VRGRLVLDLLRGCSAPPDDQAELLPPHVDVIDRPRQEDRDATDARVFLTAT